MARKLEMEYFKQRGVYTEVPRGEAKQMGVRVITTKWVDTTRAVKAIRIIGVDWSGAS